MGKTVLRLSKEESDRELVDFMDGPYAVRITRSSAGVLHLVAVEGEHRTRQRASEDIELSALAKKLLTASESMLEACRERGFWGADEDELQTLLSELHQVANAS